MATPDPTGKKPNPGLPGAEGSEFYAPPEGDRRRNNRRSTDRDGSGGGRRSTDYQLRHRSQRDFPEAYEAVSTTFWEGLSQQQVDAVMRLQATAMEKAGFEKGAPKFFIEDFDPSDPSSRSTAPARGRVSAAAISEIGEIAPRLILGGILLGMGALALALGVLGMLEPAMPVIGISTVALITGGILAFTGR